MSAEGRPKTSMTLGRYPQSGYCRRDHDGEYPEDHGPSLMAEYPEPLAAFLATNRYLKEVKLTLMWVEGRWMQLQAATVGAFPGHGAIASSVPVAPSTLRSIPRSNLALARMSHRRNPDIGHVQATARRSRPRRVQMVGIVRHGRHDSVPGRTFRILAGLSAALARRLLVFLRRYVTYCARRGRLAAMNGAAQLFAKVRGEHK